MRLDLLDCNGNDDQDEVIVSSSSSPSNSVISSSSMTSVSSPPASSNYAATPATPIATTTNHLHSLFSQLQMTSPPPKPSTSAQFELDWRKLKGNSDIAAQYLNVLHNLIVIIVMYIILIVIFLLATLGVRLSHHVWRVIGISTSLRNLGASLVGIPSERLARSAAFAGTRLRSTLLYRGPLHEREGQGERAEAHFRS